MNSNNFFKILKTKKGFTLVEILVVITVLGIMGVVLTEVFVRNLRANNKAQIISALKNNGQSALETIDKNTRNADEVVCPPVGVPTSDTLVIKKRINGLVSYITYQYVETGSSSTDNSYLSQTVITSDPPPAAPDCSTLSSGQKLTDSNPRTGVTVKRVTSGQPIFKREVGTSTTPDIITIDFLIAPGTQYPEAATGIIDPIEFKTTISLR